MWNDVFAIRMKQGGAYKSLIKLQAKEAADIAVCHSIRMIERIIVEIELISQCLFEFGFHQN